MLKTWTFWKTFFTTYIALVAGIWGIVQVYSFFREDELKKLFDSNWLIVFYIIPLFIAFSVSRFISKEGTQVEYFDPGSRRIMLNHVENFWVKGILKKSLYGAALLELGIKEDPGAINYPWAIKRESTNETLPAGKSMLEIFEEIGAGRSLLILGAPGSGKTTMLLELTRQLIERARNDESESVPIVFNLASWTEKQTLAEWLADQLNIIYTIPKKAAPKWVSENKMLLLLDGLDEIRQERRSKCVAAINQFRNEHGLTSFVICSRIEEYNAIDLKLSLEGAIKIQPLTTKQVNAYFGKFGKSFTGVKVLLKKDKALRELAETPLMLSIMTLAYKDIKAEDLLASNNKEEQRKYLFDTYINRMFERPARATSSPIAKWQTLHYLSWLSRKMIQHNIINYQIEVMQPSWLEADTQYSYKWVVGLSFGLIVWLIVGLIFGLIGGLIGGLIFGLIFGLSFGLICGLIFGLIFGLYYDVIQMVDKLSNLRWSWIDARNGLIGGLIFGLIVGLIGGLIFGLIGGLSFGLSGGLIVGLIGGLSEGIRDVQIEEANFPGQRIKQTLYKNIIKGLSAGLGGGLIFGLIGGLSVALIGGLSFGLIFGLIGGLDSLLQHYVLRNILIKAGCLPQQLIPFLEYAVELIFLRRVGGSYIFIHRLLMEHFAEMEVEKP